MNVQIYSNNHIDRAVHLRDLDDLKDSKERKYIPIWNGLFFIDLSNNDFLSKDHLSDNWFSVSDHLIFLGLIEEIEWYCIDVSHITLSHKEQSQLQDIRKFFVNLSQKEAALLAYSKGMVKWHSSSIFCGLCGHKTLNQLKGHKRVCTNENCRNIAYPRIDPCIITLIEYKPTGQPAMCLLNRRKTQKGYICSTLAGFVEIGESLEDTIIREMKEEVNVQVQNIRYITSQPWPFPASIMIGFFAETMNGDFKIDNIEIKDAKWYTANEIEVLVNEGKLELSKDDSIAQTLIKKWISINRC